MNENFPVKSRGQQYSEEKLIASGAERGSDGQLILTEEQKKTIEDHNWREYLRRNIEENESIIQEAMNRAGGDVRALTYRDIEVVERCFGELNKYRQSLFRHAFFYSAYFAGPAEMEEYVKRLKEDAHKIDESANLFCEQLIGYGDSAKEKLATEYEEDVAKNQAVINRELERFKDFLKTADNKLTFEGVRTEDFKINAEELMKNSWKYRIKLDVAKQLLERKGEYYLADIVGKLVIRYLKEVGKMEEDANANYKRLKDERDLELEAEKN